jgi:hypothetical protein
MIKPGLKLWGAVLVICFYWVCNVEAAGQKEIESSFLRHVQMFLKLSNEHQMDIKAHPEKSLHYVSSLGIYRDSNPEFAKKNPEYLKPWKASYKIFSDQFTYDIRTTNSLISPYISIATFNSTIWVKVGGTKEECLRAPWEPVIRNRETWRFLYQDGKWITDPNPDVEQTYP